MNSSSVLARAHSSSGMWSGWNPKLAASVALFLVFLCGAASGALLMDFRVHNRYRQPAFDTPAAKSLYLERLQHELNLTPAQSEQIESVLDDFWQYYHVVLSSSKDRVEQLLNPEQRQKFDKMLQQQR